MDEVEQDLRTLEEIKIEGVSYEDYLKWDTSRRKRYPMATHWVYQSRVGDFRVAEWNIYYGGHVK